MLEDVVAALHGGGVSDVRVLAADAEAVDAATALGLVALSDPTPDGDLRAAVDAGLAVVGSAAIRLVVAADLPRLRARDVAALVDGARRSGRVTVLPTPDGGTAVLLLPPRVTVPARYGPGSAALHAEVARGAGLAVDVLPSTGSARDVDGADDLADLIAPDADGTDGVGPATAATLATVAPRRRT